MRFEINKFQFVDEMKMNQISHGLAMYVEGFHFAYLSQ